MRSFKPESIPPVETKTQFGAVVVFKPGVTRDEAERALQHIARVIELPDLPAWAQWSPEAKTVLASGGRPAALLVREFNPDHGSPVFYIP
jgi:hypothetical protein